MGRAPRARGGSTASPARVPALPRPRRRGVGASCAGAAGASGPSGSELSASEAPAAPKGEGEGKGGRGEGGRGEGGGWGAPSGAVSSSGALGGVNSRNRDQRGPAQTALD